MNREVVLSLLALDSYNRGYGRNLFANGSSVDESEAGRQIGTATILNADLPEGSEAAGFYAIAYNWNGELIISFRGTNFPTHLSPDQLLSVWQDVISGWSIFTGLGTDTQALLARDFFENSTGFEFFDDTTTTYPTNITFTGHSLGGALAGYVSARSLANAVVFDPVPFGSFTQRDALSDAFFATIEEMNLDLGTIIDILSPLTSLVLSELIPGYESDWQEFVDRLAANIQERDPYYGFVDGYSLQGEIAASIENIQFAAGAILPNLGVLGTVLGLQQIFQAASSAASGDRAGIVPINNRGLDQGEEGADSIDLHSMSSLSIMLFGEKQWASEGGGTDWESAIAKIVTHVGDDEIGESFGYGGATGLAAPGAQMAATIAYSLLDEGERPYGDTAIRAMFGDADDLGKSLDHLPTFLGEGFQDDISRVVAEFAGFLANERVHQTRWSGATNGVLTYHTDTSGNGAFLEVDLTDETWSLDRTRSEVRESATSEKLIQTIFESSLGESVNEADKVFVTEKLREWLAQDTSQTNAEDPFSTIDSATITLSPGTLFKPETQGKRQMIVGSDGVEEFTIDGAPALVLAGAGSDVIWGTKGDDALVGGDGGDELVGGDGNDWFFGGSGKNYIYGDAREGSGNGHDVAVYTDQGTVLVLYDNVNTTGQLSVRGNGMDDTLHQIEEIHVRAQKTIFRLTGTLQADASFTVEAIGTGSAFAGELQAIDGQGLDHGLTISLNRETGIGQISNDQTGGSVTLINFNTDIIATNFDDTIFDGSNQTKNIAGLAGNDDISVSGTTANAVLSGGSGRDRLVGGDGNDLIDAFTDDANEADDLWGGAGNDVFLTNDGDVIHDPDGGDCIKLDEEWLRGGRETGEGTGVYESSTGIKYTIDGSTLTITTSGSRTITIQNFTNGLAGIRLLPPKPDTDEAEERRDPLIIDLDGNRNVVTNRAISNAYFDLDNDGFAEKVAWSTSGDGFLVRDLNGNGQIDDGSEMFGTGHTDLDAGSLDRIGDVGFFELASFDSNLDGFVTAADAQFDTLRVWIDVNSDAVADEGELVTLAELGIVSIGVIGEDHDHVDITGDGSVITAGSTVLFDDGSTRSVYDAYLSIDQYDARENFDSDLDLSAVADLPNLLGTGTVSDLRVAMSRDPGLEELVRSLANLPVERAYEIGARVEAILLRWTGADQADADGRGPNIDGQVLHALEQITGQSFNQAAIGPDPRGDAAALLTANWGEIVQRTTAKLLGQLDLGSQFLPGLQLAAGAFFEVDEGTTLASVLDAVATAAPSDSNLAVKHWATAIAVIAQYNAGLGMTDEEIFAEIDASGVLSGLPLSATQLAHMVAANSASGVAIGTDRFAERVEGNDVLFADRSGVELRGRSQDDIYIIASDASGVTVNDNRGVDHLVLLGQTFGDLTITAGFDDAEFRPANEASLLTLPITITLENDATGWNFSWSLTVRDGSVQSEIDHIEFGDGTTMSVTDVVSGIEIPAPDFGIYVLEQGVLAPAGTAREDFYFGGNSGDRFVFGGQGDDRFVETDGNGADGDVLIINALLSDVQIEFAADGADLLLRTASGSARIVGQFARDGGIERFQFADGSEMLVADVQKQLTTGSTGDDHIFGSATADLIDGAGGTDRVEGGYGADSYVFGRGYGSLTIVDGLGGNNIDFGDFAKSEVSVVRHGNGVVLDLGNGDSVTLSGSSNNFELRFADGVVTVAGLLLEQGTGGSGPSDGVIYGSAFSDYWLVGTDGIDVISSGTGQDYLSGELGDDTYIFSPGAMIDIYDTGGFDIISIDARLSFDQMIVYDGGIRFEGDDGYIRPNNYLDNNGVPYGDPEFIEALVFADGRTLDLTRGYNPIGSASDDILYDFSSNEVTFRPGAGNDRIFTYGTYAEKTVVLEQGFGHDVFYSADSFQIDLTAFVLDDRVGFSRQGADLVITTDGGANSFTLHDGFGPFSTRSSGNRFDGSLFHFSDGISLSVTDIAVRISIASDGDDQLFFQTVLDGGAGNDTLYGDSNANEYHFGRGYGHDVIKDEGRGSELVDRYGNDLTDTLVLDGLNRADVSFARSQSDPTSIVMTILDTGETLTIDGAPFDGYTFVEPYPTPVGRNIDTGISNVIETILFADGTTMSQAEVELEILAAEATSGDDFIVSFGDVVNSTGRYHIDGGAGDDVYLTAAEAIGVVFRAGGGSDTILFGPGDYRPAVDVRLDGLSFADLALDIEQRDGRIWTILKAADGSCLEFEGNLGAFQLLTITDETGNVTTPWQHGPLVPNVLGTVGDDFLRGQVDGEFSNDYAMPNPINDLFDGGPGDDIVAGFGGMDIVRFGRGDGVDTLFDTRPMGTQRDQEQHYVIEFASDISPGDVGYEWLSDGSGRIAVVITGTDDRLILSPDNLAELVFADGTRFAPQRADLLAARPMATSGDDTLFAVAYEAVEASAGNDTVHFLYQDFGWTSIEFGVGSGSDVFGNQTGPANTGDRFWTSGNTDHEVVLTNINSLDELSFLQAEDDPRDLIIEILATGETLRVVGQFSQDSAGYDTWVIGAIVMPDGTYHSWMDVLPRLNRIPSLVGDDQTIESGPVGGLLSGGIGNDTLVGGTGNDNFVLSRGFDEDIIEEAGGIDTLFFDEGISQADVFFSRTGEDGADLLIEIQGADRLTMTIEGQFADGSSLVEFFRFADGSALDWSDVQDFILVNSPTSRDDTLIGFASDNAISALGGNDRIDGGQGDDVIDGGAGRDVAIFSGSSGEYQIETVNGMTTVVDTIEDRNGIDTLVRVEDIYFEGDGVLLNLITPNTNPEAADGAGATAEDQDLIIAYGTLLALASDADGDALNVSVGTESHGRAWLDLDGNVRFRPDRDFAGEAGFNFTVSDGNGGIATAYYAVAVEAVNDAPRILTHAVDLVFFEDEAVEVSVPGDLFFDPDGGAVTVSVTLADGAPLPGWLIFDGTNLSGQPPQNFAGEISLSFVGSDGSTSASQEFTLSFIARNDAPDYFGANLDREVRPGDVISIAVDTSQFVDAEGDPISLQLLRANGEALPDWLVYSDGALTGTVPDDFDGILDLVIVSSDGQRSSGTYFTLSILSENSPPLVSQPLDDFYIARATNVNLAIPSAAFTDPDGDELYLEIVQADGSFLPEWLIFDGASLVGTVPLDGFGEVALRAYARDSTGSTAVDEFSLFIGPSTGPEVGVSGGTDGNDRIVGRGARNVSIFARNGDDYVTTDAWNVTVSAGGGNDIIEVLGHNNTIATGIGSDIVIFDEFSFMTGSYATSWAKLTDFTRGQDRIAIVNGTGDVTSFATLIPHMSQSGEDTVIKFDGLPTIKLENIQMSTLTADDFIFTNWITSDGFGAPPALGVVPYPTTTATLNLFDSQNVGNASERLLTSGLSNNSASTFDGSDHVTSTGWAVNIFTGRGNDVIEVMNTNNYIVGGPGYDYYVFDGAFMLASSSSGTWATLGDFHDGVDKIVIRSGTGAISSFDDLLALMVQEGEHVRIGFPNLRDIVIEFTALSELDSADFIIADQPSDIIALSSHAPLWIASTAGLSSVDGAGLAEVWIQGSRNADTLDFSNVVLTDITHIDGGAGNDVITGTSVGERLVGGEGNDTLFGGEGHDIAIYSGAHASYVVTTNGGVLSIVDTDAGTDGNDGTDALSSIETAEFKDGVQVGITSPIILDLGGDGIQTLNAVDSHAQFDHDGDGVVDDTSWISAEDAFLFLDRDGDGTVTGVAEMSFIDDVENAASDLAGLAAFDSNSDGVLDELDDLFAEFGVWRDADGDGRVEDGETLSLTEADIASINLTGAAVNGTAEFGGVAIVNTGSFTLNSGETREFADAALTYFSAANSRPNLRFSRRDLSSDSNGHCFRIADDLSFHTGRSGDRFAHQSRLEGSREAIFDLIRAQRETGLWELCEPQHAVLGPPPSFSVTGRIHATPEDVWNDSTRSWTFETARRRFQTLSPVQEVTDWDAFQFSEFGDFRAPSSTTSIVPIGPKDAEAGRSGLLTKELAPGLIADNSNSEVARRLAMIRQDMAVFGIREHEEFRFGGQSQPELCELYS